MERRAPRGKFLIPRGHQRSAEAREFGMVRAIMRKNRLDRLAVGQLNKVFRLADNFFQPPEKKYLDPRCL